MAHGPHDTARHRMVSRVVKRGCKNLGFLGFYSASALLAMQSAVLARGILSVRPSVRPSVRHVPVLCQDE